MFSSRFCVVTEKMILKTGLENLCGIGNSKKLFREKVLMYINKEYTSSDIENKRQTLQSFITSENAQKIIQLFK